MTAGTLPRYPALAFLDLAAEHLLQAELAETDEDSEADSRDGETAEATGSAGREGSGKVQGRFRDGETAEATGSAGSAGAERGGEERRKRRKLDPMATARPAAATDPHPLWLRQLLLAPSNTNAASSCAAAAAAGSAAGATASAAEASARTDRSSCIEMRSPR